MRFVIQSTRALRCNIARVDKKTINALALFLRFQRY